MINRNLIRNLQYRVPKESPAHTLAKAIESGYLASKREDAIMEKVSFAPSSIGAYSGKCPRRWVMAFAHEYMAEETTDAMGVATMQSGSDAHARIQKALELSGLEVENEREIWYEDPPIHAFIDSIITMDGERYIVEIKTTDSKKFYMRQSSGKGLDYHYYQLLFYMYIEKIDNGFLLYENREDLSIVTIPVKMTEKNRAVVEEAFDWMRTVRQAHLDGKMPRRPFTKSNINCKLCPLRNECWSMEDGDVAIPAMEVNTSW